MKSRLRAEDGFSLTELMTVVSLLIVVVGATLGVLDGFVVRSSTNTRQNHAQDVARVAIDRMARQLRNLASPTDANVESIDRATSDDLVFQTVDPVKRRVRYCLSSPARKLWMQTQAFPLGEIDPGMPTGSACPAPTGGGAGEWATQEVVAADVVNREPTPNQRVFDYAGNGVEPAAPSVEDTAAITGIRANIWIDVDLQRPPGGVAIASGDFLRNQNQSPTASFTLVASPAGSRRFVMNASESHDPESRTLEYYWYKGTGNTAALPSCRDETTQTSGGFTCLGRGLTLSYTFPADHGGGQTVTLKVVDPGGLTDVAQAQTPSLP